MERNVCLVRYFFIFIFIYPNLVFSQDVGCGFSISCDIQNYNLCPPQFDYYGNETHPSGQATTGCNYQSRYPELSLNEKIRIPINIFSAQNSNNTLPNPIINSIDEVNSIFTEHDVPFEVFLNFQNSILVEKDEFTEDNGSTSEQTYYSDFFDSQDINGVSCNGDGTVDCPTVNANYYKTFFKTQYPSQLNFLLVDKLFHYTDNDEFVSCGSCNALEVNSTTCAGNDCYFFKPGGEASFPTDFPTKGALGIYRYQQFGGETWAHELGHFFGLSHTFSPSINPNFPNDQDLTADTNFDSSCCSDSPSNNIMDYSNSDNVFTICQTAKMVDVLYDCRSNLSWDLPKPLLGLNNMNHSSTNQDYIFSCNTSLPAISTESQLKSVFNSGNVKWYIYSINTVGTQTLIDQQYYSNELNLNEYIDASFEGEYLIKAYEQIPWNGNLSTPTEVVINISGGNCSSSQSNYTKPISGYPSTGGFFSWQSFSSITSKYHAAIDFAGADGQNIYAVRDGTVVQKTTSAGGYRSDCVSGSCQWKPGNAVVISHVDNNRDTFYAVYGHFDFCDVIEVGASVTQGQVLGQLYPYCGRGGTCTGGDEPHLHFGINTIESSWAGYYSSTAAMESAGWVDPDNYLDNNCGTVINPPQGGSDCIECGISSTSNSNLNCSTQQITVTFQGTPDTNYSIGETGNESAQGDAQAITGSIGASGTETVTVPYNLDPTNFTTIRVSDTDNNCFLDVLVNRSICSTISCDDINIQNYDLTCLGNGEYQVSITFEGDGVYDVYDNDDTFCSGELRADGSVSCNYPSVSEGTYTFGPITAENSNYIITIEDVNNPLCQITQPVEVTEGNCVISCIDANCITYSVACNGDGTYNADISFAGDNAVEYSMETFIPSTATPYQSVVEVFPNQSGVNIITNIPVGQDVVAVVRETNVGVCSGDSKTIQYFPDLSPSVIPDCGNNQFSVEICIDDFAALSDYTLSDGNVNNNLSSGSCVVLGPYPSGTNIVVNLSDPLDNSCGISSMTTYDCNNPNSCDDGVMNNGELGVDCGGSCPPCVDCTPSFTDCPSTITMNVDTGEDYATINFNTPTLNAPCDPLAMPTLISGLPSGSQFPLGINGIIYDYNGTQCMFNVIVLDNEPPSLSCASSQTVFTEPSGCFGIVPDLMNLIEIDDNNEIESIFQFPAAGSLFGGSDGYQLTVTIIATDEDNNSAECEINLILEDNESPEWVNCPTNPYVFGTDPDQCSVLANWSIPVATDNCDVTVFQFSGPQPGEILVPGQNYTILYYATDNANPAIECEFTVQVNETQNPELNCPQDVFVENDLGVCEAVVNNIQLEFAIDNCPYTVTWTSSPTDVTGTGTSASDNASGAIFPVGVTTVTYTITENDDFGNGIVVTTCDLIVTVTDTEHPLITCPPSVTIGTDDDTAGNYDCATDYTWTHPTPTDNCAVTVYTITYTNPNGSIEGPTVVLGSEGTMITRNFDIGITTILYHVEDEEGNITECTFTVEVIDDEDPMIFCEQVVATNTYTYEGTLDLWPEDVVTATISVLPSMTITDINIPLLAGTQADMGDLGVTLTSPGGTTITLFDDLCAGSADFNMSLDDAAATNITVAACSPLGGGMLHVSQDALAVFNGENSQGDWILTFTNTSVDVCGVLTDWHLEIIGNDVTADANRLQVQADEGNCSYTMNDTDFDPPFTDNCPDAYITHDYDFGPFDHTLEGSVFELGETTVIWTVTDAAGNAVSCTLIIEVLDTEAPRFTNCPRPDIILNPLAGTCEAFTNFSLPIALDNCVDPVVTQTDATGLGTGMMFPVGTTILTYEAIDAAGNTDQCEIRIIVNDSHPVLTTGGDGCPADVAVNTDPGDCGAIINNIPPSFTDSNCPVNLAIIYRIVEVNGEEWASGFDDASGNFFDIGDHIAQYRAQDQPVLLISEVTHHIQAPLGGNDVIPAFMSARPLPDGDFLELTNFGSANLDIGGLDIERIHALGRDTFRVPALEILAPGEVFVLHFGHDYDSPADHYYNAHCANNLLATDGAAYIISLSGRVLDVAAINGFDPIGAGVAGVATVADWSGGVNGGDAGIRRISVWDDNEAADFIPAYVCGEITIGSFNPDLSFAAPNGQLTALQARLPNKLECSFDVSITDNELPICGSYEPYDQLISNTAQVINAGDCFETTINVPNSYLIADINTIIQGAAGDFANLTFTIISPAGEELVLSDGICAGNAGWDIHYDSDSLSVPFIQDACADINTGEILRPVNDLNIFNSRPVNGSWILQIAHNATVNNDSVTFTSWELLFSERIPYQQGDTIIENDFRLCGADFTWIHTGLFDNCPDGDLTITYTFEDGTVQGTAPVTRQEYNQEITRFFDVGVTTVRYDMTDSNGNQSHCSFDLTVLDTEPPQLSCPSDTTLYLAGRECEIVYIPTDWYTMDNCGVVDTVVVPDWNIPLPIGENVVTLTVLDEAGNPTVCMYTVTVVEYVPVDPIMACIEQLNVSLGSDCLVEITADMVLTGDNYHCIRDYIITLYTGPESDAPMLPSSPFVDENYIGQTIVYSVYDPDFDITCWGYINVDFYEEPEFECPPSLSVNCLDDTSPSFTGEPVLLSCALGGATITHEDAVQEFGACDAPRVIITRTWTVADSFGHSSSCVQTITIEAFDVNDIVFPSDYNNVSLPAFNCAEVLNDPSLTHPDSTGYPTLNNTTDVFLPNFCNASYLYNDEIFNTCPGSYEIIRTWQVRNTCLPYEFGVNPRVHVQIIHVLDTDGPQVVCPDDETISTGPFDCTAVYVIPAPTVDDACSGTTYTVTTSSGSLSLVNGVYYLANLSIGTHTIEYRVEDECIGFTECSYQIIVEDQIEPTASCNDELNVSLGGGDIAVDIYGTARIFATDVDEGSSDHCSEVTLDVRRNYWNNDDCDASENEWSDWGEYVDFLCCDIGQRITIELRVTDEAGNYNICWLTVDPEDKIVPYCTPPLDVTFACTDLPLNFPGDIQQAYDTDFYATSLMMNALFGAATATDNCAVDTIIERTPQIAINDCGWGTITRRFEAWQWKPEGDVNGNGSIDLDEVFRSVNSCSQLISITEVHDFVIDFPEDASSDCSEPNIPTIITSSLACDVLAVNIGDPEIFAATGDECYKLSITYDVINWCVWDGEYLGYVLPRITEDDGESLPVDRAVEGNERPVVSYSTANGLLVDRRHTDRSGNSSIPDTSPALPNYGRYIYTQFVKVYDSSNPEISVEEYGGATELCPDLLDGQFGDAFGNCEAEVNITFKVTDQCELFDGTGNLIVNMVSAELDLFAFDTNGNGEITANEFISEQNASSFITNISDSTFVFNGNFPVITAAMGDNVVHALRVLFEDGCGNQTSSYIPFDVLDCKGPAPICISGLAVTLMPQLNGGCAASIWANDFEGSPIYDCTGQGPETNELGALRVNKYAIYRASEVEALGSDFVPSSANTGLVLNQGDGDEVIVYIYAFDEDGNYDYCETYVAIEAHADCLTAATASVAGAILTENSEAVQNVEVNLNGAMSMAVTTSANGQYQFDDLTVGDDYSITPYLNLDPVNGVTTFDIILISKHILGVQALDSPYKHIAADVNRSNSITTLDLIRIRKLILNITDNFPNNTSWRFVASDYEFPQVLNPWAEEFPELINENNLVVPVTNADFIGVKIGDVNTSASANLHSNQDRNIEGVFNLLTRDKFLKADQSYPISFKGEGLSTIQGYQLTLQLDQAQLVDIDYGLTTSEHFGFRYQTDGYITHSWNQNQGVEINEEDRLFSLFIRPEVDGMLSDFLGVNSRYTIAEAYRDQQLLNVALQYLSNDKLSYQFELYQNTPNPSSGKTLIMFNLPEAEYVSFSLRDVQGKLVFEFEKDYEAGDHTISLTEQIFGESTGVFTYTLIAGENMASRKMVVLGE